MIFSKLVTSLLLALPAIAAPAPQASDAPASGSSSYWLAEIARNGSPAFGTADYKVFRNVKDYGAVGDGAADDTEAINKAIADGGRCGQGCGSSTTTPAIVYFPPGTYMVSQPVVQYYYTQLVGDAVQLPTLKAMASFEGMAVIDADPYNYDDGSNWYTNQNNFFRQIRNFNIDLTGLDQSKGAGIHWQVAQATSLQNIHFNMVQGGDAANQQKGIFMDNGSGGFMSDLSFTGGGIGMFIGNQQFTTRNLTFSKCNTAIYMNWNWVWTLKDVKIDSCGLGLDLSTGGPGAQTVGSALFLDSTITNTPIGVNSSYATTQTGTNGTLIIENVDMTTGVDIAIKDASSGATILPGNQKVANFVQGNTVSGATAVKAVQASQSTAAKPESLLNSAGGVFTRSKPQYETVPAANFVSVKSAGAKGDGQTDDTAAIQKAMDSLTADQILYFDHGAYIVTDTVKVPKDIKITGEIWPLIMAKGANFANMEAPRPVFQVGQPGDTGAVEMTDLMFETAGPAPGAIMIEWNLKASSQGAAGMWDVHNRIGGSAGTDLLVGQCAKNNGTAHGANEACEGAFMMMHITNSASDVYLENTWFWVADHDLEPTANSAQIDIYNGRGVLIESQGPVWLYGTSSEHSVLYNYQLVNASAVYMALIQTETAYFQGNPVAPTPFTINATYTDPNFDGVASKAARTWGLRVVDSKDVFVYGAGLYSFFDDYNQECLATADCQDNMVSIESSAVHLFGLSTKAATNMVTVDGESKALDADNRSTFCATLSYFTSAA
ncbi:putative glycoside hydrolase family 55 protein [Diaporthe ampelina]|uniref:Putative glycoside hydrolase family 55 protein n=1 Tax=Diaporthe ampelina TaxID=1214573 RepID=A0A0G2FK64_9PEZI|nr:putative glycoside hydrolase family 55 protein [Diaporthe ampelina]